MKGRSADLQHPLPNSPIPPKIPGRPHDRTVSMIVRNTVLLLVAASLAPAIALPVQGQQLEEAARPMPVAPEDLPRPSLRAFRAAGPIEVDGLLSEASWSQADSTDGVFWTTQPDAGTPAPDRTVVRILYDDEAIYVGARLYDAEPHRAASAGLEPDFRAGDSDLFGIALDASRDMQSAYIFAANPAGARWDAQSFADGASLNTAWEGVYDVQTTIDEKGWTMEMRIPITTLRFPTGEGGGTWGINFSRQTKRRNEYATWAAIPRQYRAFRMSEAGTLEGLPNFTSGRNLQVKPFLSSSRMDGQVHPEGATGDVDVGIDAKWAVTPRLIVDLTALTDFSQVEVDEEQINLTRFSLFFPEKRDFFLENDGIFTFADDASRAFRSGAGPQNFKLFHSRRIGLSDDRSPVPIAGGARMSGRVGRYELGLMEMQTRRDGGAPAENFGVARVRRNLMTSSDVGFILVNRQQTGEGGGDYSRAGGVDANFRFARLQINGYAALTDDPAADGDRSIGAVQLGWRDPVLDFSVMGKHVGDDFRPGVGFVSRTATNQWFASGGVHLRELVPWLTELNPYVDVTEYRAPGGSLESREVKPGLVLLARDGGRLTAEYSQRRETLTTVSSILGVELPAGQYDFGAATLRYVANGGRRVAGTAAVSRGEFFDGDRTSVSGTLTLRPNEHWLVESKAQRNRLVLAGERVDADLVQARVQFGYNTRTFLSTFVQYNRAARELVTNVRFNLIHAPLSDVFVVFSERRQTDPIGGVPPILDRGITLKITRLVQF